MKKVSLILILVLSVTLLGFADNSEKQAPKDGFKIKPKIYWSIVTPIIIRKVYRFGITVFGLDSSLFKCGNFYFPSGGIGLQTYQKRVLGWHQYNDYYGYSQQYYGYGYRFFFEAYVKVVPVKYRWNWVSKLLKRDSFFEVGLAINPFQKGKKDIFVVVGFTFGNLFKKKVKY